METSNLALNFHIEQLLFMVLLFLDSMLSVTHFILLSLILFCLISDFGKESSISLANLKAEDVLKQVERLSKS